jgi:hypothetical protein
VHAKRGIDRRCGAIKFGPLFSGSERQLSPQADLGLRGPLQQLRDALIANDRKSTASNLVAMV